MESAHVGRLGTITSEGWPMIKPLNFVYLEGRIYFHSAMEGEKVDDIKRDPKVCFEVDLPIALVKADKNPCRAEYLYRSVIAKGIAYIVNDNKEKLDALKGLMIKYQPKDGHGEFLEDKLKITLVVRIDIEEMIGKEDLGGGEIKEAAIKALEGNAALPIIFERNY